MKDMKYLIILLPIFLFAKFATNDSCKSCHPAIYDEFQNARHSHSSIFKDPIHKKMWELSPSYKQKKYTCGKCHTPTDEKLLASLDYNQTIMPDSNATAQSDGVACSYCHRIKSIENNETMNINIISKKEHIYYGNLKDALDNPFHKSTTNKRFQNGNVCIGCHSHYRNKYGTNICSTNQHNELDSANCVSCHMPKVDGSPSNLKKRKKHAFHGFAGIHNDIGMLSRHVSIEILRGIDRFFIAINNLSPHALSLHPMRVMELQVSVVRDKNITNFKPKQFVRVLGTKGHSTTPWEAKEVIKNTSIKGNEKRVSTYMFKLKKGDIVNVKVGYYLLSKKLSKKLGLDNIDKLNRFILLKQKVFIIKPNSFEPLQQ